MNTLKSTFKWGRVFALAGVVSFAISSCNTDTPDTPEDPASNPPTPTFNDGYGTLSAVKSVTFQDVPVVGQVEIDLGLAVAVFFNGVDYNSFVNGGAVTCEGESLEEQDNGSYVFLPSQNTPTGIDFSGNPDWSVGGNGDVPAFSHTTGIGFPSVGAINSGTTVSSGSDYTLSVASVSGADSVIFMMGGVVHTVPGNQTSTVFTSAEIDGMGTGPNYAQAAAYKVEQATYSSKNFWFVNEKVVTQSITIE